MKSSTALFEIDFSEAKVGDETYEAYQERRGDAFIKEWSEAVATTHITFMNFFNRKNKKGLQLTSDATGATYKMLIKVSFLNMGDSFSTFMPYSNRKAGGMLMNGSIDIIDIGTNNIVCTLNINGVKGIGVSRAKDRLQSVFNYLADNICIVK